MAKQEGREKQAVVAAALAGRKKNVGLGPIARDLAEKHTSAELQQMAQSDAAAEARAKKARKPA